MGSMAHILVSHYTDNIYVHSHRGVNRAKKTRRLYMLISSAILLILLLCLTACRDTTPATMQPGAATFKEYPLPQDNSGLMRPAIDQQGDIWFGEMGQNYLASFDPKSQKFQQIKHTHGT